MRYLFFAILLTLPSLAFAGDPCSHGWNGPITSSTNPTTSQGQAMSHTSFGSDKAQKTAYPH